MAPSQAVGRPVAGFTVIAEYRGAGGVVVLGPVSGKRYIFPMTGARVLIDVRDRDLARSVRGLRLLESR
jgi:hypothetical protein